jgi:hypothetical protein
MSPQGFEETKALKQELIERRGTSAPLWFSLQRKTGIASSAGYLPSRAR